MNFIDSRLTLIVNFDCQSQPWTRVFTKDCEAFSTSLIAEPTKGGHKQRRDKRSLASKSKLLAWEGGSLWWAGKWTAATTDRLTYRTVAAPAQIALLFHATLATSVLPELKPTSYQGYQLEVSNNHDKCVCSHPKLIACFAIGPRTSSRNNNNPISCCTRTSS